RSEAGGRRDRLRRSGRERSSATVAELAAGLHLGPTGRADRGKRGAALSAESCAVSVGGLAPGTLHAVWARRSSGSQPPRYPDSALGCVAPVAVESLADRIEERLHRDRLRLVGVESRRPDVVPVLGDG